MLYCALRPFLFALDPEQAHRLSLASLERLHRLGLSGLLASRAPPVPVRVMGLDFPNPVGLAAGQQHHARDGRAAEGRPQHQAGASQLA